MHARRATVALLAAASVAGLAGCATTAAPAPSPSRSAAPPPFPRIAGTVVETRNPVPGDWLVRVRVEDASAAYAAARKALQDHGYQLTKDRSGTDGGDGQACTREQCVWFTATADADRGPNVLYEVFHGRGIAP